LLGEDEKFRNTLWSRGTCCARDGRIYGASSGNDGNGFIHSII